VRSISQLRAWCRRGLRKRARGSQQRLRPRQFSSPGETSIRFTSRNLRLMDSCLEKAFRFFLSIKVNADEQAVNASALGVKRSTVFREGYGLIIDERVGCTYPDAQQAADGTIYLTWDYNRSRDQEILMTTFREEDVLEL
jgi:hypothetical protein